MINVAHDVFRMDNKQLNDMMPGGTKVMMFGRTYTVGAFKATNLFNLDICDMYSEGRYIGQNSRLSLCYYYFIGKLTKV